MEHRTRKICFVTGTRADYGIQSRLMQSLAAMPEIELQIIATNMHLSPAHGMTVNEIEADGLRVDRRVEMLEDGDDSPAGTMRALGRACAGIGEAVEQLRPDMLVVLGDRYEMLAAASAALIFNIPLAHLYGGETTEGAYDDNIRHAITQMATIHLTSTEQYRRKVISMGRPEHSVHCVGALGVDNITHTPTMSLAELEESIGHELGEGFLLVTFHPVTTQPGMEEQQTQALLDALSRHLDDRRVLITLPNSDTGGNRIARMLTRWADEHSRRAVAVTSLGRRRYFSALTHCAAVVGNSSSGLIEAPSFLRPTLDIGDRQRGRAAGPTVLHCADDSASIAEGIARILDPTFMAAARNSGQPLNPYSRPDTLETILRILTTTPLP